VPNSEKSASWVEENGNILGGGSLFKIKFRLRNFRNGAHLAALRATSLVPGCRPLNAFAKGQFVKNWQLALSRYHI
jgi:hypothetical protein